MPGIAIDFSHQAGDFLCRWKSVQLPDERQASKQIKTRDSVLVNESVSVRMLMGILISNIMGIVKEVTEINTFLVTVEAVLD